MCYYVASCSASFLASGVLPSRPDPDFVFHHCALIATEISDTLHVHVPRPIVLAELAQGMNKLVDCCQTTKSRVADETAPEVSMSPIIFWIFSLANRYVAKLVGMVIDAASRRPTPPALTAI